MESKTIQEDVDFFFVNEKDDLDLNTPLHVAILERNVPAMKILLASGADVNRKCNGITAMHVALFLGRFSAHQEASREMLEMLLAETPDLTAKDDGGRTALHVACEIGFDVQIIDQLVDCGGKNLVEIKDRTGMRPLHVASAHGHLAIVQRLLELGVDASAVTTLGNTPLHYALVGRNWSVAIVLAEQYRVTRNGEALAITNRRGRSAGEAAISQGIDIPERVAAVLEGRPCDVNETNGSHEVGCCDKKKTVVITHPLCMEHHTCTRIVRGHHTPYPPENVKRLEVLCDVLIGVLRSDRLLSMTSWCEDAPKAYMGDVLRVHDHAYVSMLQKTCSKIPDETIASMDGDTTVSNKSYLASLQAAGCVCAAVDRVCGGASRNAFCAVRPPGHHAGSRGVVEGGVEKHGSMGFCLLNNVAIGAAYALNLWRARGIKKVAIVDFDVHHGNGTEEIVRGLVPSTEEFKLQTPDLSDLVVKREHYRPWLGQEDPDNVLFVSTHGYGKKQDIIPPAWFYPSSGCTMTCCVDPPPDTKLETSTSDDADAPPPDPPMVLNLGFGLMSPEAVPGASRLEWRNGYRRTILPRLVEFNPDLIMVSAGFDAHKKDSMACNFIGLIEDDYAWVTSQLIRVANTCCGGRIVSTLEGGYNTKGGPTSVFARSVAAHVGALAEQGLASAVWDENEAIWESEHENYLAREREKRRQKAKAKMMAAEAAEVERKLAAFKRENDARLEEKKGEMAESSQAVLQEVGLDSDDDVVPPVTVNQGEARKRETGGGGDSSAEVSPRKRSRRDVGEVDYVKLAAQLDKEKR
uniref:Histone deacetylase domain-containing protein n=1 Tax=Octactis speculum TaxID=3111310 RepID=A0A7S2DAK1_9STRA